MITTNHFFSNHNTVIKFTSSTAILALSVTLLTGNGLIAHAATPTNSQSNTQLTTANYSLPAANNQGAVVEQQINQNVTRTVNVLDPAGHQSSVQQVATLTGLQSYDQTHGVVLEGYLDNGHFTAVNIPAVKDYHASTNVPSEVVTPGSHDQTINVHYVSDLVGHNAQSQQKTVTAPDAVVASHSTIGLTPSTTHAASKNEAAVSAKHGHVAEASFGLAGLLAMIAGLAGWKKWAR